MRSRRGAARQGRDDVADQQRMLRTTEQLLEVPPLGDAAKAASMLSTFNL